MINPKVSVLMPVYNAELFIKEAIESVLKQTYTDWELIIADDGSTDTSIEIAESFADQRIRIERDKENRGIVFARNRVLTLARGEYIAWLDADDISLPDRLQTQVNFLDAKADIGLVGTWIELIDQSGTRTGVAWKNRTKPENISAALLFGNQFTNSSVMIRKSVLPSDPYRYECATSEAEDYDLWIRLAQTTKLATIQKILVQYRTHATGATQRGEAREKRVRMIMTRNLSQLGVVPTDRELLIHRTNFGYTGKEVQRFLSEREQWLTMLKMQNEKLGVYPKKAFAAVAAEKWLGSCSANARIGWKAWQLFWKSSLSKDLNWREHWRDVLKFFVKSLLGR